MLSILTFLLPAGLAAQPYSQSMIECAALYQNAAQWANTDEAADKLMQVAIGWVEAAEVQARAEGTPRSSDELWDAVDNKSGNWAAKGAGFFMTEEFRDWMKYCRSFVRDRGLKFDS